MLALEVIAFIAAVVLGVLWIAVPDRNWEPWIVLCGSVGVAAELSRRFGSKRQSQTPSTDTQTRSATVRKSSETSSAAPAPTKIYVTPEKTAKDVKGTLKHSASYFRQRSFESLFKDRWITWQARLTELPIRHSNVWYCQLEEEDKEEGTAFTAHTSRTQDMSSYRIGEEVAIDGQLKKYDDDSQLVFYLDDATIERKRIASAGTATRDPAEI